VASFAPLTQHLSALQGDTWTASFTALGTLLGAPLPKAARRRQWWSGGGLRSSPQARAWRAAGWRVGEANLEAGQVTFVRGGKGRPIFRPAHSVAPPAMERAALEHGGGRRGGFGRGALLAAVLVAGALGYLIGRSEA
jgi:hypothetical protein